MVKSARKSETETFVIIGRFHRFEDLAGKRVYGPILNIQKKQNKTKLKTKNKKTKQNKNKKQKQKQTTTNNNNNLNLG